jgi:hypothetical protein
MNKQQNVLLTAIEKILTPLVRILLRNGVAFGEFGELARKVYVDVASRDFLPVSGKQTDSRVSGMTGLSRKEVKRLKESPAIEKKVNQGRFNRAVRVISGWRNDKRFLDKSGRPRQLQISEGEDTFADLVNEYSGDVTVKAMLSILEESGSLARRGEKVRLVKQAYIPAADATGKLEILGSDMAELALVIEHNLNSGAEGPFLQRKVMYDNIDPENLEKLRDHTAEEAAALLKKLDRYFAGKEQTTNSKSGRKVSAGIYYYEYPEEE